eukprot:gene4380-5125_t
MSYTEVKELCVDFQVSLKDGRKKTVQYLNSVCTTWTLDTQSDTLFVGIDIGGLNGPKQTQSTMFTSIDVLNFKRAPKDRGLIETYNNPYSPLKRLEQRIPKRSLAIMLSSVRHFETCSEMVMTSTWITQLPHLTKLLIEPGEFGEVIVQIDKYNHSIPKYRAAQTTLTSLALFHQQCSNQTLSDILASKTSLTRFTYSPIDAIITIPSHIQRLDLWFQAAKPSQRLAKTLQHSSRHIHMCHLFLHLEGPDTHDLGTLSCMTSLETIYVNITPALSTIGNIFTGDSEQTQLVIDAGALPFVRALLESNRKSIKKDACWVLSNITAGTEQQIQSVIDHNIIPLLIGLLTNAQLEIKREAAWAITNALSGAIIQQIDYLVGQGCIPPLCELLCIPEPRIIDVALNGIEYILAAGLKDLNGNPYLPIFKESGGVEKIIELQRHKHKDTQERAIRIFTTYFRLNQS